MRTILVFTVFIVMVCFNFNLIRSSNKLVCLIIGIEILITIKTSDRCRKCNIYIIGTLGLLNFYYSNYFAINYR